MNINVNPNLTQVQQLDRFVFYRDLNQRLLLVDGATGDVFCLLTYKKLSSPPRSDSIQ
ncbi:MAG: hypothetical protein JNJ76_05950 [Candidatus Competibacter sp.]|nr:hypothetical protein [Candidatus Competibacter sp.]